MLRILILYITFFGVTFFPSLLAQEMPPIVKYKSQFYNAGNQNWMIAQDSQHFLYFANNEGLLEFNGSNWTLYPSPNETIIRSVKIVGEKIFTGCYMEFGYWERQPNGLLQYASLSQKVASKLIEDEHFWNIISLDDWVLFQSFNRIYVYNTKTDSFQFIDNHHYIFRIYKVLNSVYYQAIGEGLFEIINGKGILVSKDDRIKTNRIVEIFTHDDGLLFQTERAGIFKWKDDKLEPFRFESEAELIPNAIFSAQKLSNGGFALGTISNGIFILNKQGKVIYHITQNTGLGNNTILSLFEDADNNLWMGLDNGIDCINLQSPIKNFIDDEGYLGTVYAAIKFQDKIYIGTNQGLFYKSALSNDGFHFVNGTKGQVWSLFEHDKQLFCGHDLGTFLINDLTAQLIFKNSGTWKFNAVPHQSNLLLQGNYNGLSVLEKKGNTWVFRNKLNGYDISSRYFEITNEWDIYIGHEYKGVIKVKPNSGLTSVEKFEILQTPMKGKHISLAKYNDAIYFAGKQGIYKLAPQKKVFVKDETLSDLLKDDEYISGKLNMDSSNKMWLFTKNYIYYFTSGSFNTQLKSHKISIPFSTINPMLGYENVTQISNNEYLIGKTDGYFIINLNDYKLKTHNITLTNVTANKLKKPSFNLSISEKGKLQHAENNISLNFTVPQYDRFINVDYQYILEGFQNQWSEWSNKSTVSFKNLPPGEYTFKARAKVANETSKNMVIYTFKIQKPWYQTNYAVLFYLILFYGLGYFINKAYRNHYHKQREKLIEENNRLLEIKELENEKELMKLKNEQLVHDVDIKSRELAVSTMSMIKKNELLELIKEDLKKTTESKNKDFMPVITMINRNIKEENSWEIFKEAYDNLDKDFLKKMKAAHPSLTPSDLKLCAYLRLNLSSKEIAPMLHISIRSVEIKRYRLRKKINLIHDEGLVNYILNM
jgi:AraC family transcriptional regulator, chitin signaling transcriptional activator